MKLLGTTTSPYTRKVRVLLNAIGKPYELLDIRSPAGAAELARVAPLAKVPVLVLDAPTAELPDAALPDSALIASWLWETETAALHAAKWNLDPSAWRDRALQAAVEGAMDAAINNRYLQLDGVVESPYIAKQKQRVDRTLSYLEGRVTFQRPLGFAALSLGCTLDWMAFRDVVDVARWPALALFRQAWTDSGVGAKTEPHE